MINIETATEKAIVEAATRLFLEKGFSSTSTTEIAKEAGCTQAMVHYYFRTKENLFEAIFSKKFEYFVSSVLDISKEDLPFEEKLRLKIESHFEMLLDSPKFPILFSYEMNTNPKRLNAVKERLGNLPSLLFADFQRELDLEIEKGNIRKMKVIDVVFSIVSLNIGLFIIGPILKEIAGIGDEYFEEFIKHRKKENVNTIIRSLKP
jgi:TetR/AcrR family transcriptional regulator